MIQKSYDIDSKGVFKMNGINQSRDFVGYEYKDITAPRNMESVYADGYQNFGWELDEKSGVVTGLSFSFLKFKRDRKILNKAELTRLQRQFDACVGEIVTLEKSKTTNAIIVALIIGLIGCAFLAGSVFAVTAEPPNILLCIIFGLPGIVGWILPYFVYKSMCLKRSQKVEPLIDAKYDEIYEVCEKANGLLPKKYSTDE